MTAESPSTNKGPRLTLVVNGAVMARPDPSNLGVQTPMPSIQTPSSTIVEYGDHSNFDMTAAERANHIFKMWITSSRIDETITPAETPQEALGDVTPVIRKPRPANSKIVNERLGRFFSGLSQATGDPNKELVQRNRSLHDQIAALQFNEQHLLKDNQNLTSHVLSLQQSQEAQKRRFDDELRVKQAPLEARIKELEQQVAHQNERLFKLTLQPKPSPARTKTPELPKPAPEISVPSAMSDADVALWFETRAASWVSWVDEFAHDNANRMAELHPIQQREALTDVESFVRLTADRKLPELLSSAAQGTSPNVTRLLLRGMLSNFIVNETLASPFWIFSALNRHGSEPESPSSHHSSTSSSGMSATGFRMDYAMFSHTGFAPCPSPYAVPPAPTTARSISMLSPRHAPPQVTPLQSLSINTRGLSSSQYRLPTKPEMEDILNLLMRTQQDGTKAESWRAQLMQMLSDGGLSKDASHPSMASNVDQQMLANTRREYARQLKERFLSSAARFFLRDQDAQGIAKLEGQLVSELDLALRFSAQVWSRQVPMHFIGLPEMATSPQKLSFDEKLMMSLSEQQRPAGEGIQVIMVLQPAVGTYGNSGLDKVWQKAQVVAASRNAQLSSLPSIDDIKTPITAVQKCTVPLVFQTEGFTPTGFAKPVLGSLNPPSRPSSSWVKSSETPGLDSIALAAVETTVA